MIRGILQLSAGGLALMLTITAGPVHAAGDNCIDATTDLLVWVEPSTVQVPGPDSLYESSQVTFGSEELEISLIDLGVEAVGVGFPEMIGSPQFGTRTDGEQVRLTDYSNVFRFKFEAGTDLQAAATSLEGMQHILHVDRVSFLDFTSVYPNDPLFAKGEQWAHSNWGQYSGSVGRDMHTPAAWSISKGTGIIVGIIDGGATGLNPDLAERFTSASDPTWNNTSQLQAGHGFLVAGVIGATVNNRQGVAGVAWEAQMISENIEEAGCNGAKNTWSSVVPEKIRHAMTNGARVLNNSYNMSCTASGSPPIPYADFGVRTALADAYKMDRVVVAAMGNNSGTQTQYPAAFGNTGLSEHGLGVIAVGATARTGDIYLQSNTGNHIDVVAPGVDVMTTTAFTPAYASVTGTSVAAPAVSGIAALLLAHDSTLSNDDVEHLIRYSSDPQGGGWNSIYGEGRVDARKALDYTDPSRFYRGVASLGNDLGPREGSFSTAFFFQNAPAVQDVGSSTPLALTGHF